MAATYTAYKANPYQMFMMHLAPQPMPCYLDSDALTSFNNLPQDAKPEEKTLHIETGVNEDHTRKSPENSKLYYNKHEFTPVDHLI